MEDTLTRAEHAEFARRIEEEDKRQNRRIELLEEGIQHIVKLTTSVEKLAVNMESMVKEQESQGNRLEALEGRDGEKWRKAVGYLITAIISATIGFIFSHIGLLA